MVIDLLKHMLQKDPKLRKSATELLKHEFFKLDTNQEIEMNTVPSPKSLNQINIPVE